MSDRREHLKTAISSAMPFLAAIGLAFATLPLPPAASRGHMWEVVVAACAAMLAVVIAAYSTYVQRGPWLQAIPAYLFFLPIALLRDSEGGASSGFGVLVLIPLVFLALHSGRPQLLLGLVLMVVMFSAPILVVGMPQYPPSEWRRALLWVMVGSITVFTIQQLLERIRGYVETAEELARTDLLTGLPNRRALFESLERELARAHRGNDPLCLAFIDLDFFKKYNDEYGHPAGDELLKQAAAAWIRTLRAGDILARYGGEEFVLVLTSCDLAHAEIITKRVLLATPKGQSCSIGLVMWQESESADALVSRADKALYQAKEAGRHRVALG